MLGGTGQTQPLPTAQALLVKQEKGSGHKSSLPFIFFIIWRFYKKLNNIYIDADTGYELNGTMIGFNLLDKSYWTEHVFVYQVKNKLYAVYAYNFDDGFRFTNYNSHANIIYI